MKISALPENPIERALWKLNLIPDPIIETFHACVLARAIMVGTKVGVFEALEDGPLTAEEVAKKAFPLP